MYIGALRLTGENDRLQSHDFLLFSFFWSMCGMTEQSQRETDTDDVSKKRRKSVVAKFLALKIDFEVAERS